MSLGPRGRAGCTHRAPVGRRSNQSWTPLGSCGQPGDEGRRRNHLLRPLWLQDRRRLRGAGWSPRLARRSRVRAASPHLPGLPRGRTAV